MAILTLHRDNVSPPIQGSAWFTPNEEGCAAEDAGPTTVVARQGAPSPLANHKDGKMNGRMQPGAVGDTNELRKRRRHGNRVLARPSARRG